MALSKVDLANFLDGTIPQGNVANASLGAVTALPAGVGGKVLQVVQSVNSFQKGMNSTSPTDVESSSGTTWEPSITPSSTSSKILSLVSIKAYQGGNATGAEFRFQFRMFEKIGGGSYSQIDFYGYKGIYDILNNGNYDFGTNTVDFTNLRTPSTTSEVKYKFDMNVYDSAKARVFHNYPGAEISTCTLMEIAG
jgi:hypothetical protein